MIFINVKELKNAIGLVNKISDKRNPCVAINLSKEGTLSLSVLFDRDGMVNIPVEFSTIKTRSDASGKSIAAHIDTISKIIRQLPVIMEEVELEIFDADRISISGDCDPDHHLEYELRDQSDFYHKRDYDLTEERVVGFATGAEIANVLNSAQSLARKSDRLALGYIHMVGEDDELLIEATDGNQVYKKYVYTQETFSPAVDIAVSPSLGVAISKLAFSKASWEVYQNFVRVILDDKIEVYSTRSLIEYTPNLSSFGDASNHATIVLNPNELKSRLGKINSKTDLWLYTQDNQLAIEYFDRQSHGSTKVKNTLKTPPALAIVNCGRLMQVIKSVKKTTDSLVLRLPKLPETEVLAKEFYQAVTTVLLEFDRNSHIIAGIKTNLSAPPSGVKDWLGSQGWAIFKESQPASTKARSVADILSDRWTGQGWERPELLECDCGSIHQLGELAVQYEQVFDDCECCEAGRPLVLQRIDYRCSCNVRNTSTYREPILAPICMGCGKKDEFTVTHYFQCANCNKSKIFETLQFEVVADCKVCPCGAVVEEEELPLWHCDNCNTEFDEHIVIDLPFDGVDVTNFDEFFDSSEMKFIACPYCKSKDSNLTSQSHYWCTECDESIAFVYPLPATLSEPTLPCPVCDKDLRDTPTQSPFTDIFLVGTVARF